MFKLKTMVKESPLLDDNEKKMVLFVLDRQLISGECVVTNAELLEELDVTKYQLSKITKSLNKYNFFNSGGDKAGVGGYRQGVGYFQFRNVGKNKRIIINELLIESFLNGEELGIEKIKNK